MSCRKHLNIFDHTLRSMLRRKFKNFGIVLVFTLVVFAAASVLFLSHSFKQEAFLILKDSPELIVQKMSAGRHDLIPTAVSGEIARIPGVSGVEPRYWGYYYDSLSKANYTVLAASGDLSEGNKLLSGRFPESGSEAAIGRGIARARFVDPGGVLALQSSSGKVVEFTVSGIFASESEILTSDLVVINAAGFRQLFGIPEGLATDLHVRISNELEAPVIARKIRERFPWTRPILREEIIRTYDTVFGWRSGLVLTIFSGALAAFLILAWDKATGLSAEEKREIGILKALGWETSDILEMKFWEGLAISLSSFLLGILLAYCHVFFFGASVFAPALKGWSVIYPEFRIAPFIDVYQVAALMMLTLVPYIASTIIPSWKAAITDPDEVVRG